MARKFPGSKRYLERMAAAEAAAKAAPDKQDKPQKQEQAAAPADTEKAGE